MATVKHYIPQTQNFKICPKGGAHQGQGLNLICLDPLCRQSPLACATCFTQIHKYHKIVGLSKFVDDYKRNIGSSNIGMQQKKINKHYNQMRILIANFKRKINRQINEFQKIIQSYAAYLSGNSYIRDQVSQQLNIELDPVKILHSSNLYELEQSIRFILNNSLFDNNLNMANVSGLLKQNQDRISALLDKMVYMTQFCQKTIQQSFKSFNFANQTLRQQKSAINEHIRKINSHYDDPSNLKVFMSKKDQLAKIIEVKGSLVFEESQKLENEYQFGEVNLNQNYPFAFKFGKNKHQQIEIEKCGKKAISNVTALKPFYALAWPNLNKQPQQIRNWSIKINKCRDFASKNTMALGIGRLSDTKLSNFEGNPTNCLLISSQGYVLLNGKSQKTNFSYRQGDILYFSYDPYYGLLQVSKDNGRKLCLKAIKSCQIQPLYVCAKLTYASDQVELL